MVGNPYSGKGGRYKERYIDSLNSLDYLSWIETARNLDKLRELRRLNPSHPFDYNIKNVSITGLLALLRFTGLRISEIVGDPPHKYFTQKYGYKFTKEFHGLRRMDFKINKRSLRIKPDEIRKFGKRDEPLYILRDRLGVEEIISQISITKERRDCVFPFSKTHAWRMIKLVAENRYPHFFRLSLATEYAKNPETSIRDLQEWFAWVDPSTIKHYMGLAGKTTMSMAKRIGKDSTIQIEDSED